MAWRDTSNGWRQTRKVRANPLGNVLIIAYHFPPQAGSSGLLRSLKYCRYLPEFGWHPAVLTPHPRAYEKIDENSLSSIPGDVTVIRAFAMDTKKHMASAAAISDTWPCRTAG